MFYCHKTTRVFFLFPVSGRGYVSPCGSPVGLKMPHTPPVKKKTEPVNNNQTNNVRTGGFETFVMTGEKIIRTTPTIKQEKTPEKTALNGNTPSPTKKKRTASRIPKPSSVSSSPRSSPSHVAKKVIVSPEVPCVTDQESVNNNVITEDWIKSEATKDLTNHDPDRPPPKPPLPIQTSPILQNPLLSDLSPTSERRCPSVTLPSDFTITALLEEDMSSLPQTQPPNKALSQNRKLSSTEERKELPPLVLGYPEMPRQLDIPPDDISAEDAKYCDETELVNVDDLPPPPEELLADNCGKHNSLSLLGQRDPLDSTSEPFSAPPNIAESSWFPIDQQTCVSADKIDKNATQPHQNNIVRTSKSHENYLQQSNSTQLTLVDIDLNDDIASSIDVLHYNKSVRSLSKTSLNSNNQTSLLESTPDESVELGVSAENEDPSNLVLIIDNTESSSSTDNTNEFSPPDVVDLDSIYHQPIKEVDLPSVTRLAKRLYNLEGFVKNDIAIHLSKK